MDRPFREFRVDISTRHNLGDGFALTSAPERAFGINYAIYRGVNPDCEGLLEYGSDLEGRNYCFWVSLNDLRVGGIIIRPGHIEGLFVIPPYTDHYVILRKCLPLLLHWSDRTKGIEAVEVLPYELDAYQRLGFRFPNPRDRWPGIRVYIRATESLDVTWGEKFEVKTPAKEHIGDIAELHHGAYRGHPSEKSSDEWAKRMAEHFGEDHVPNVYDTASSIVYGDSSSTAVGACLIRRHRLITRPESHMATVAGIAVRHGYRRLGLGSNMLKKALDALVPECRLLRLSTGIGNPAEAFYLDLGFWPGVHQYHLLKPPEKADPEGDT